MSARPQVLSPGLGLIGTLVLHAAFFQAVLPYSAAHVPSKLGGRALATGSLSLLLIPLVNTADSAAAIRKEIKAGPLNLQKIASASVDSGPIPGVRVAGTGEPEDFETMALHLEGVPFLKLCREYYGDGIRLRDDLANVSVRAVPDGGEGQGPVEVSGTGQRRARLALRCLQAFGTFGATVVASATGE
jgi:hypothetical protein